MEPRTALIRDWPTLLTVFTLFVGGIYYVKEKTRAGRLFRYVPAIL